MPLLHTQKKLVVPLITYLPVVFYIHPHQKIRHFRTFTTKNQTQASASYYKLIRIQQILLPHTYLDQALVSMVQVNPHAILDTSRLLLVKLAPKKTIFL